MHLHAFQSHSDHMYFWMLRWVWWLWVFFQCILMFLGMPLSSMLNMSTLICSDLQDMFPWVPKLSRQVCCFLDSSKPSWLFSSLSWYITQMVQMLWESPASWLMATKAKTFANCNLFSYIGYTGSDHTFVLTFSFQQYDTTLVQWCLQWLSDTRRYFGDGQHLAGHLVLLYIDTAQCLNC